MIDFFQYLLEASIIFMVLLVVYRLFVSNLTFYKLNRYILLLFLPLSLLLSLVNLNDVFLWSSTENVISAIDSFVPFTENISEITDFNQVPANSETSINLLTYLTFIYVLGVLLATGRFFASLFNIYRLQQSSEKVQIDQTQVYASDVVSPFSYFNWIFVPKSQKLDFDPLILKHEIAHTKLLHSFDLLLVSIYGIVFWFNPFLPAYRKSLRSVHEFQADQSVLTNNVKTSEYLQLILENVQKTYQDHSYNYFNNFIIKKRINMITKTKSKKRSSLKYVFLLASSVMLSLAFADTEIQLPPTNPVYTFIAPTAEPPSIAPIKEWSKDKITSLFGHKRKLPKGKHLIRHQGIDIRSPKGTPVIATADGQIIKAQDENDWGNLIIISHEDGYETWYAHLDGFNVETNQQVKKGDVIGYIGTTGLSTGYHLHYEVRKDNKHLDPLNYIK